MAAAVVLLSLGVKASESLAQEIAPFRLTGVEGHLSTRYLRDEIVTRERAAGQAADTRSRQAQSDLREELFLMTHSYVYHPRLLSLDIGGGPIFQYGAFATDSTETESLGGLYNLTGRATFLREKPYRGAVFYDHLNPTLSVSPGQILTQETTRYGLDLALLEPVTPVPLQMDATRSHTEGRGADRIIDDRVDRLNLRASRSFGTTGSSQAQYQLTRQESLSGSPNLPIQGTTSLSQGLDVDSRLQFGANRYELMNLVSLSSQAYELDQGSLPDRHDLRVLLDARARPWEILHAFGAYSYGASDQGESTSVLHSASAGLSLRPIQDLETTLGVRGDDQQTGEFSARSWGGDGSVRYQRALPLGVGQASYAARYDERERRADATQTSVIGERLTLQGTTAVALAHPRVVSGSVGVSNVTRTQTYTAGQDYTLTVVGLETRVQRLIGGSIVDGQEVLVDYAYDTGGTFGSSQLDQTFTLGWALSRYFSAYYRRFDSTPSVTSGTPSYSLNRVRSDLYGARAELPLKVVIPLVLGGSYEWEDRRETIAPSRRDAFDASVQLEEPFFSGGTLRLSTRRTRIDYASSAEDVDLLGYDARLWVRLPLDIELGADASWEQDTGGVVPRSRAAGSLKIQWRFRKVTLTLDFGHARESQGTVDRDRTLIQFLFRRDF